MFFFVLKTSLLTKTERIVWRCTYSLCVCVHMYLALGLSEEFSGDTLLGGLWWCAVGAGFSGL